jgi:predicted Zn-dependent peptidase
VQEFFDEHYAPNNAAIGLAGDFEPEEAMALVKEYFGDIPPRETPRYDPPELTPQTAERKETMVDPLAELPAFHIAYHIPPERSPDHYPLDMLSIVLGDGESSRLYQDLVKGKELMQEIDVSTDGRRGPDLFSVWGVMSPGKKGQQAREIIYREIARIARQGVTERELEKAKNRIRSVFVFGLQSNMQRAQRLAEYEMYWGDAKLLNDEAEHYLKVTNEDIKRVAQTYFNATNRTVLDVLPPAAAEPTSHRDTGGAVGAAAAYASSQGESDR